MDSGARSTTRARKTVASSKICEREWRPLGSFGPAATLMRQSSRMTAFAAAYLVDVDGDLELVERGANAVGGMLRRLADDGHARGVGALGLADRQRDDVDVEAAKERGDAGENAGFVFNEGYKGVEHGVPALSC